MYEHELLRVREVHKLSSLRLSKANIELKDAKIAYRKISKQLSCDHTPGGVSSCLLTEYSCTKCGFTWWV